ncbi:anhydro-N-acetylmuramic acid kinase [Sulfobacillus thermosulfidooxidans]|uniref:anhydro-N-acetylmuramic acid kinase n=1 Tax=Sulfobacillus thermosulfidooxidans TaxID=28034 RepID=UPI00096BCEFD|nr:anhydro-N-acetylmuramic acid kinase [Sulfobacillus thermosulfidooxidans]OLZ09079.1 hypothetical protein BFX05_02440 [Sulfobacillus thermosulfidooxidans]OLZ15167.1 hypothetical protein BFX06_04305 [Sulfobacillus thermosulfidooxidans]OLZ22156.1 hypothetical protein BFX07_09825 [Sulfobacillus thermosulfidooxidans]
MAWVVGLNSGSSLDSIDGVLIDMDFDAEGWPRLKGVEATAEIPWPEQVHNDIVRAINLDMRIDELCRLSFVAGAVFSKAVNAVLHKTSIPASEVAVIGVDGQTIYQEPPLREKWVGTEFRNAVEAFRDGRLGCTLQIGDGAVISALTGIPTISQFRPADIAVGGTGAPIEQLLDYFHYRHIAPVVTLNIGGIANIHAVHADQNKMMAFDTGPGNILMDRLAQTKFGLPYDKNGTIAATGHVNSSVLDFLMSHPFLRRDPPRSAWREDFSLKYLQMILDKFPAVEPRDMMATMAEFTVQAILQSLHRVPFLDEVSFLIGNGGGVYNDVVINSLKQQIPQHIHFVLSDQFGIPAKSNEAVKFATLGFATIHHLSGNIPHASGATRFVVLGRVHYPPYSTDFELDVTQ